MPTGAPAGGGDPEPAAVKAPKATGKWLTASLIEDIPTVIAAGFDEATRRDPATTGTGSPSSTATPPRSRRSPPRPPPARCDVTILVDYLHVAGYVWDAAKALFCTDTIAGMTLARTWVHERSRMILHG